MKVKPNITITKEEQESLKRVCDLISDINDNEIANATIQNEVLNDYNLGVEDLEAILYDIKRFVQLED